MSEVEIDGWVKLCLLCETIKTLANGEYIIEEPMVEEFAVNSFPFTLDSIGVYAEIFTGGVKASPLKFGLFSPNGELLVEKPCLFQFGDWRLPGSVAVQLSKKISFEEPGCYLVKVALLDSSIWHPVRRIELKKIESGKIVQAPILTPTQISEFQEYMNESAKKFFKDVEEKNKKSE